MKVPGKFFPWKEEHTAAFEEIALAVANISHTVENIDWRACRAGD